MKHIAASILLVFTAIVVTACTGVRGNGDVIEESRDVSGFEAIELSGVGIINITQGESEALTISAESNIMPHLVSELRNNTLVLRPERNSNINPTRDIVFNVTVTDLNRIEISGAGSVNADSLESDSFHIEVSGASNITIESLDTETLNIMSSGAGAITIKDGLVTEQTVTLSGAGSYEARNFKSEIAQVTISGAGSATVAVSDALSGSISGLGSINYVGNPTMNVSISGAGTTNKLADE